MSFNPDAFGPPEVSENQVSLFSERKRKSCPDCTNLNLNYRFADIFLIDPVEGGSVMFCPCGWDSKKSEVKTEVIYSVKVIVTGSWMRAEDYGTALTNGWVAHPHIGGGDVQP